MCKIMDNILTGVVSLAIILLVNVCLPTQGVGDSNAQATVISRESDSSGEVSDNDIFTMMRYYAPQFVWKTEQDNDENDFNDKPTVETKDLSDDENNDKMKGLHQLINRSEHETDDLLSDGDDPQESFKNDREMDFEDENEMPEEEIEEMKRYQPKFAGHRPFFGARQSNPMFIGKRYRPMFVGKRYASIAASKRYQSKFVGKRYIPRFVGKRYTGTRFESSMSGKAYMPAFVGKRDASSYTTKMYIPSFIGKRNPKIPRFVGKRYQPTNVKQTNNKDYNNDFLSFIYGKQSNIESIHDLKQAVNTINARLKRSLLDETGDIKRAWGRYIPWENMNKYYPFLDKRFDTSEFIGRRDSLSSIISALYALQYARDDDRSTTKRFQAPMFIGKRNLAKDILPESTAKGFHKSEFVLPSHRNLKFLKSGDNNEFYRDNGYFMYRNPFSGR